MEKEEPKGPCIEYGALLKIYHDWQHARPESKAKGRFLRSYRNLMRRALTTHPDDGFLAYLQGLVAERGHLDHGGVLDEEVALDYYRTSAVARNPCPDALLGIARISHDAEERERVLTQLMDEQGLTRDFYFPHVADASMMRDEAAAMRRRLIRGPAHKVPD